MALPRPGLLIIWVVPWIRVSPRPGYAPDPGWPRISQTVRRAQWEDPLAAVTDDLWHHGVPRFWGSIWDPSGIFPPGKPPIEWVSVVLSTRQGLYIDEGGFPERSYAKLNAAHRRLIKQLGNWVKAIVDLNRSGYSHEWMRSPPTSNVGVPGGWKLLGPPNQSSLDPPPPQTV